MFFFIGTVDFFILAGRRRITFRQWMKHKTAEMMAIYAVS
jgi:hypothetical protein